MDHQAHKVLPGGAARPKLLYIIGDEAGFSVHWSGLARTALEEGFEVTVATRFRGDGREIRESGFKVAPLELDRTSRNPLRELRTFVEIVRLMRRERPDVVQNVTIKPIVYGGLAGLLLRPKAMLNLMPGVGYVFASQEALARLLRPLIWLVYRLVLPQRNARLIVMNDEVAAWFEKLSPSLRTRIDVLPGVGVDLEKFSVLPEPDGPMTAACVSRMMWDKGVGDLVAAARMLQKRGAAVRIQLVGRPDPGNPSSVPEAQLRSWHEEGVIEYLGFVPDLKDVWRKAHVCVLPSYYEGFPMVLLEAAACGRALVTTDVPGCRHVVQDGKNGLLVPPRDPTRLAQALESLAESVELRRSLAAAARHDAESRYSTRVVYAQMRGIYRRLLGKAPSPGSTAGPPGS